MTADFVVLPEGSLHESGQASLSSNSLLASLAAVVAKHGCWAVLGTMAELVPVAECVSAAMLCQLLGT
jgi:hypothetical protein